MCATFVFAPFGIFKLENSIYFPIVKKSDGWIFHAQTMKRRVDLLAMSSHAQLFGIFSHIWFAMELLPAHLKSERRFRCISWRSDISSVCSLFQAFLWFLNVFGLKARHFRQHLILIALWLAVFRRHSRLSLALPMGNLRYSDFDDWIKITNVTGECWQQ